MTDCDLLVRGGTLVNGGELTEADVAVADGVVVSIGPELALAARDVVAAAGLHVLPGVVDIHVHFNEPGRTDWEGFATGSAAVAAGGGTGTAHTSGGPCAVVSREPSSEAARYGSKVAWSGRPRGG